MNVEPSPFGESLAAGIFAARVGKVANKHRKLQDYLGETHVYSIRNSNGTYKIGQSARGVRMRDGASIRAEEQARRLQKETGEGFETEIRQSFPDKSSAREYETRLIERFRSLFGEHTLPGNKSNR